MGTKIVVPNLGESILEATVARWIKKPGDQVAVGEPVVELETEKVNLEVGAERAGFLASVVHPEGTDVRVGDILGEIEETQKDNPEEARVDMPSATPSPPENEAAAPTDEHKPEPQPVPHQPEKQSDTPPLENASPVARRMVQEHEIPASDLQGSGPGGRIVRQDVERYLSSTAEKPDPAAVVESKPPEQQKPELTAQPSPVEQDRREERQRMSRRRRTIAQRLVEAQHTAAMLTTFNDVDMSAVMEIRRKRKEAFKTRYGVGLGIVSFFVKASILALKEFPRINAEIQGEEMVLKHYYDIGVAVAAEEGLVVPVVHDADRLSFAEIEQMILGFVEKARANNFSIEDLRGGTFTITNGGVFGSLLSTPILNAPQVAILGLHRIEERPVALDGQVVIRSMMYLALSYDHRIVDGKEAVQFLARIKEAIENPELLLIEA